MSFVYVMKNLKFLICIFPLGIFTFSGAEENILDWHSKGLEIRPVLLGEFGELQRKEITLRKLEQDGEIKFHAMSKEGEIEAVISGDLALEQVEKLFNEKEVAKFLCLFYETFWVEDESVPSKGEGTTTQDFIYSVKGVSWCWAPYIVIYELKLSE